MDYVLGYLFSEDVKQVALIHKQRPDWQKDKWNGIGGKIEQDELPPNAMQREFREETGVDIDTWMYASKIVIYSDIIHVFTAANNKVFDIQSTTNEKVGLHTLPLTKLDLVHNVELQIQACLSHLKTSEKYIIRIA